MGKRSTILMAMILPLLIAVGLLAGFVAPRFLK
jgi:hypothetical protein